MGDLPKDTLVATTSNPIKAGVRARGGGSKLNRLKERFAIRLILGLGKRRRGTSGNGLCIDNRLRLRLRLGLGLANSHPARTTRASALNAGALNTTTTAKVVGANGTKADAAGRLANGVLQQRSTSMLISVERADRKKESYHHGRRLLLKKRRRREAEGCKVEVENHQGYDLLRFL